MLEGFVISFDDCEHEIFFGSHSDVQDMEQNFNILIFSDGTTLPTELDSNYPVISVRIGEAREGGKLASFKSEDVFQRTVAAVDADAMRSSFSEHFKQNLSIADAASVFVALEELIQREDDASILIVSSDKNWFSDKPLNKGSTDQRKGQFDLLFQRARARTRIRSLGRKSI